MNYFKPLVTLLLMCNVLAIHSQSVKYAPAWFGPNANPVADFGDARIPTETTVSLMGDYGDAPLVYATKYTLKAKTVDYFAQYQYGIMDFPYQQIRVGISFPIVPLTPKMTPNP